MNTQNLLLSNKGWLIVGMIFLLVMSTSKDALGSCGAIVELSSSTGEEESRLPANCGDPFGIVDGPRFSNVDISIGGESITDGMTLTFDSLPVDLSPTATFDDNTSLTSTPSFTLYHHAGADYVNDHSYTVNAIGTYTLVHTIDSAGLGGTLQQVFAPTRWLRKLFVTTAHAQSGPLELTTITFIVALPESVRTQSGSATRVGDRLLRKQRLEVSAAEDAIKQLDTSILVTNALGQLTQVLQKRESLTESEAQTLKQLLLAISLILSDRVSVGE
jgi:hypothetical protein